MGSPPSEGLVERLKAIAVEYEAHARLMRANGPVQQDDDETLAEFRERKAEDDAHRRRCEHYAQESDAKAATLREVLSLLERIETLEGALRGLIGGSYEREDSEFADGLYELARAALARAGGR